jgi:hypothetical protein
MKSIKNRILHMELKYYLNILINIKYRKDKKSIRNILRNKQI